MTKTKEEIMEGMNVAAELADTELDQVLGKLTADEMAGVKKVIDWLNKWYLQAGYKRLNRSLRAKVK